MENKMQIFTHATFGDIRTIMINDTSWFVGKDVARMLGYLDTDQAIRNHVHSDDKLTRKNDGSGQNREIIFINESGLYSLILSSKLPSAVEFKRWVTSEILPSLRKHGMYAKDELLDNPDLLISVATALKEEREKTKQLTDLTAAQAKEIAAARPKVVFADAVANAESTILVGELAKLLRQNGIKTGTNRLFAWLRANGYLMSRGNSYNCPTQSAMEKELFIIKESTYQKHDGKTEISRTPLVTGKGQQYFINLFLDRQNKPS